MTIPSENIHTTSKCLIFYFINWAESHFQLIVYLYTATSYPCFEAQGKEWKEKRRYNNQMYLSTMFHNSVLHNITKHLNGATKSVYTKSSPRIKSLESITIIHIFENVFKSPREKDMSEGKITYICCSNIK